MENSQRFFVDTLKLMPVGKSATLLVQAPYDELDIVFKKVSKKKDEIYQYIPLSETNIGILLYEILYKEFDGYVQSLEIRIDDTKVFEGYDGMEYGMFSKDFILPQEFKKEYTKNEMCIISKEW